jgi:hypothetical protein
MERRSCERFTVPGATIDWVSEADAELSGTECPLADLSRGGMRFMAARPPREGTSLRLVLKVPGEAEPLVLRGSVAWSLVSSGQLHQVAVAFSPYGAGGNDASVLKRIVGIETRFLADRRR